METPNTNPTNTLELPVINIDSFVSGTQPDQMEAKKLVDTLRKYGACAIKDSRVNQEKNHEFLNLMEKYFESRGKIFYE